MSGSPPTTVTSVPYEPYAVAESVSDFDVSSQACWSTRHQHCEADYGNRGRHQKSASGHRSPL
jgi:hypothetical protein